jgi:CheY-like chemotaxis protein
MTTQPAQYHNTHVLVVDDDAINREIVEILLAAVGVIAHLAEHGQHALDIISESGPDTFDLVLTDIQMPLLDGFAVARELRAQPEFALLPIVAMTAQTMEHEGREIAEAGLSDQIGKPFDVAAFYRLLAKWIPASKQSVATVPEKQTPQPAAMVTGGGYLPARRGPALQAAVSRFA